jgi:hypothetical protein
LDATSFNPEPEELAVHQPNAIPVTATTASSDGDGGPAVVATPSPPELAVATALGEWLR